MIFAQELKSIITLTPPKVSSNIEMQYRVKCPGDTDFTENTLTCNNAGDIDDEVSLRILLLKVFVSILKTFELNKMFLFFIVEILFND